MKVIICSVPANSNVLNEAIYANKFKNEIKLLEVSDGEYEALFKKGTFQRAKEIKPIVHEVRISKD